MPLNVCIGPEFTTGSKSELRISGERTLAWPFGAPIGTNNGLCMDPAGGLWTAPHGCYTITDKQKAALTITLVVNEPYIFPTVSRAIVNPSSAASLFVYGTTYCELTGYASSATAGAALGLSAIVSENTSGSGNTLGFQTVPIVTGNTNYTMSLTMPFSMTIGAAATKSIQYDVEAYLSGTANGSVTGWNVYTQAVGILIDPSQAGGVGPL